MSNGPVAFLSYKSSGTGGLGTSLGVQFICDFITNMAPLWNWFVFSSAYVSEDIRFPFYKLDDCRCGSNKDALEDDVAMEIERQILRSQTFLFL